MDRLVAGAGAIVHFGAIGVEDNFDQILKANIQGMYNLLEAARRYEIRRIVFASSIHVIGLHPTTLVGTAETPARPDSYYGVSKAFGENLARLYVEKAGLEIACLRIGVAAPEPKTPRNLWTWLSLADLCRLVDACLMTPDLRFAVVYGVSDNGRRWWDNAGSPIDFRPEDDAEVHAGRILPDGEIPAADRPSLAFHGGPFVTLGLGERPRSARASRIRHGERDGDPRDRIVHVDEQGDEGRLRPSGARRPVLLQCVPDRLLGVLESMRDVFVGYQVSSLEHLLQTASRAERDGADEEMIVAALLHDIGDVFAPENHSQFAASLLRPYVREEVHWIIRHHGIFQLYYSGVHQGRTPISGSAIATAPITTPASPSASGGTRDPSTRPIRAHPWSISARWCGDCSAANPAI
jgi:uronate dehydrogenase